MRPRQTLAGLSGGSAQASGLNPSLTPLAGGSGGGGGAGVGPTPLSGCNATPNGYAGGGGGGGGGALLLAASNRVTLATNGFIWANGGNGGASTAGCGFGSGGAGGSVRIVATEFAGTGTIDVFGGVQPTHRPSLVRRVRAFRGVVQHLQWTHQWLRGRIVHQLSNGSDTGHSTAAPHHIDQWIIGADKPDCVARLAGHRICERDRCACHADGGSE